MKRRSMNTLVTQVDGMEEVCNKRSIGRLKKTCGTLRNYMRYYGLRKDMAMDRNPWRATILYLTPPSEINFVID